MNIVAKDKRNKESIAKYMLEELERVADIKERQLKAYDRMMREKSSIDTTKCKGRD